MIFYELNISKTRNTPEVISDTANNSISFSGNSFPENSKKFYESLNEWMNKYCEKNNRLTINCDFNYLSSSSLISILNLFKKADTKLGPENCLLNWNFENDDEDIEKIGLDFSKIINMRIEMLPY